MKYKINWSRFKGTTKLPAQPSPSRFSAMQSEAAAAERARRKFGELPEFMGLSTKSTEKLAAESYAGAVENRMFFKSLGKELKSSRIRTAGGVKAIRAKAKPVPKIKLKMAKSKGAGAAYKIADVKGQEAFSKIVEKYTSRAKGSAFKVRTKPTKTPMDYREKAAYRQTVSSWGKDPDAGPDFNSDIMSGSSKRFPNYKFKKGQGPFASLATKKYNKKKY